MRRSKHRVQYAVPLPNMREQTESSDALSVTAADVDAAAERLTGVVGSSPLQLCKRLSERYAAEVYLKREDLQEVRSFKLRGAYNKMSTLSRDEAARGVVCASAGNHAQGVAYACSLLGIAGTVFMPAITPMQKIDRVRHFGRDLVEVRLVGESYDDASQAAHEYADATGRAFVHPFDDPATIAGQGTVGRELLEQMRGCPDVVVVGIGGGGLIGGIATYLHEHCPDVTVI